MDVAFLSLLPLRVITVLVTASFLKSILQSPRIFIMGCFSIFIFPELSAAFISISHSLLICCLSSPGARLYHAAVRVGERKKEKGHKVQPLHMRSCKSTGLVALRVQGTSGKIVKATAERRKVTLGCWAVLSGEV